MSRRLCAVALLALICRSADASSLPIARVLGATVFTNPGTKVETVTFGTIGLSDVVWGIADLTIAGQPFPSIDAHAKSGPAPAAQTVARAVGSLEYTFEISGPTSQIPVLVTIAGAATGLAGIGASFAVESSWSLAGVAGILASDSIVSGQMTGSFSDSFARTFSLLLSTNQLYTIAMRADANAGFTAGTSSTASAFIDPLFALGPGVNPLDYTLNFSSGIGNTPAAVDPVPEPATGALLLGGLGAALVRRRRRLATR
jgi:hypothetical protein